MADTYDDRRADEPPETPLLETFVDRLPADAHVLDAGCGGAEPITRRLASEVRVTGLDFSRAQVAMAIDRLPETGFVQGDLTALPFPGEGFDGVISAFAVIHVPWDEHATVFEEFHRVLRPSAPLLVSVGSDDWEGSTDDWLGSGTEMHWSQPGPDRTTALLQDAGFTVDGTDRVADTIGDEEGAKVFVWAQA
jgi:SAM-dependent methyltransferase